MALRLLAVVTVLCIYLREGQGEGLPQPKSVKFKPDFFPHTLEWEPGHNETAGERYEVQYIKYANGENWTTAEHCREVTNHFCDLTVETLLPGLGYHARVRAVSGNQTSEWKRTTRFTPQQVNLPAPGLSLELEGNTMHVSLQLPFVQYNNNKSHYEDVFKYGRVYRAYIRRTSDNLTFTQLEESTQFDIPKLASGEQYCLTITPVIRSRPNLGISTEEHCVSVAAEVNIGTILLVSFSCIFVLCMLLVFGNLFICQYVNRPVETPDSLKSPIKASSYWMEQWQEPPWLDDVVVCLDEDSMTTLSLKKLSKLQKNSMVRLSTDSGFCGDKISLENENQSLTSSFEEQEHPAVVPQSSDDGWTSTDSGLCTRGTNSGSSHLACSESQGYRRQLHVTHAETNTREDSGISMPQNSPCLTRLASRSESPLGIVTDWQHMRGDDLACPPGVSGGINKDKSGLDLGHAECHGYLKQSKYVDETQHEVNCERTGGPVVCVLSGTSQKTYKVDVEPDQCSSALSALNGYLKQASKQLGGFSHLGGTLGQTDISLTGELEQASFLSSLEPRFQGLHHNAGDIPITQKDFSIDLGTGQQIASTFITDIQMLFPLAHSLNVNEGLCLGFNPLSLADIDFKDR